VREASYAAKIANGSALARQKQVLKSIESCAGAVQVVRAAGVGHSAVESRLGMT
jgi:hypothetical protein